MRIDSLLQPDGTKVGAIMQAMTDFKIRPECLDPLIHETILRLRSDSDYHQFGKGDKLPANMRLRRAPVHLPDVMPVELYGGALGEFRRDLDIPLMSSSVPRQEVNTIEEGLKKISTMGPGGNTPNEVRNMVHLMAAGVGPEQLHLYSSSDFLFEEWLQSLPPAAHERIHLTKLSLASRIGVHFPYRGADHKGVLQNGTLAISSPAESTRDAIRLHLQELLVCHNVIVSEGLGRQILETQLQGREKLVQKINPSSALRGDCAVDAYEYIQKGGYPPIATMNDEEADFYIRTLKGRVEDKNPEKLDPFFFPSPFGAHGGVNDMAVDAASQGFNEYLRYIPAPHTEQLLFPLNISCGKQGGYHLAHCGGKHYVVFTTTPHRAGAQFLLDTVGNPPGIQMGTALSMGAGDAVGTLLSLTNRVWDVEELMGEYAKKSQKHHSVDEHYLRVASMIFVSILSRILGEYVFHSEKTDFTDVPPGSLRNIVNYAAEQALAATEPVWHVGPVPKQSAVEELGINVALWELTEGRVPRRPLSLMTWLFTRVRSFLARSRSS